MLNKEQVIEKMSERGFTVSSYAMEHDNVIGIHFMSEPQCREGSNRTYIPAIGCNVDLKKEEFELVYAIPYSINKLSTPKCGSLMNDDHFDKLCIKFEEHAHILYRYFGRD